MKHLLLALASALSLGCSERPAAQPMPAAAGSGDVAARVGDRVITVAEVDEAWRKADAAAQAQAVQAIYDGRRQALDQLLADLLIEQAAKAKGVAPEQFLRDASQRHLKPVSDAEIAAFYEENKARMQGRPLEAMREPIRGFLDQQRTQAARDAVVAELRKSAPAISVALQPPRQKVEVAATDPSRGPDNAPVVLVEFSDYQ